MSNPNATPSREQLQHFYDTTVDLWATDKPEVIPKDKRDMFFKIQPINTDQVVIGSQVITTEDEPSGIMVGITLLFLMIVCTWIYLGFSGPSASTIDHLLDTTSESSSEIQEIKMKTNSNTEQLSDIVYDYYEMEYRQAMIIARDNGYVSYGKLVSATNNVVRLGNYDGSEIEVNLYTKTITRFSY